LGFRAPKTKGGPSFIVYFVIPTIVMYKRLGARIKNCAVRRVGIAHPT